LSRRAYIKVFLSPRRILLLTTLKKAGKFKLKGDEGRLTFDPGGANESKRKLKLLSVRTLSLGQKSKHSIVMVTLRFSEPDDRFPGDDDLAKEKDSDIIGVAARLTVTITNDPPSGDPEEIPIDEEDPVPEEEDDTPEG
jgi:hypothetical protein